MPIVVNDIRELDRRVVETSIALVRLIQPADLALPTPCAGWTLGDLLAHLTRQHRGFRAASLGLGLGSDLQYWAPRDADRADPVARYETAAHALLAAFGGEGSQQRSFALPEISRDVEFPAEQAIGFHFIDYLVHGWDVARTLGRPYLLPDELAPTALRIAETVPDGPTRLLPNAAFRPRLPSLPDTPGTPVGAPARVVPSSAGALDSAVPPLDRILRLLGRSPGWPDA